MYMQLSHNHTSVHAAILAFQSSISLDMFEAFLGGITTSKPNKMRNTRRICVLSTLQISILATQIIMQVSGLNLIIKVMEGWGRHSVVCLDALLSDHRR
jgi:hypothetical protein